MTTRRIWLLVSAACLSLTLSPAVQSQAPPPAQGRGGGNPLRLQLKTIYTPRTEFYGVYRLYVVGQESRFSAHLTHITDRFEAYPSDTKVTITFMAGGKTYQNPVMSERSGVFQMNFTPTATGIGTATVVVSTSEGQERFVVENIPVEPDLQNAIAHQPPAVPDPTPSIRYTKEDGWDGRFATAEVKRIPIEAGKPATVAVPRAAVIDDQGQAKVYVQRNPEAFELRLVKTGPSNAQLIAIADGLKEGERIVTLGAEKLPRK